MNVHPTPTPATAPTALPTPLPPPALSWIHAENGFFTDDNGIPVNLRGCNLGNWFLLEMWMLDMNTFQDQFTFERVLETRFGEAEKNRLMNIYRENWITERDFENMASYGFNVVRVPFHYSLLEDDRNPMVLKPDGLAWLDRAVELAAKHRLYVILDLHGAQGGQSVDHTTGRAGKNELWSNPENQKRFCWLWKSLAAHYKDNPVIAAYDVVNEPYGDSHHNQNLEASLARLFGEVYTAIRSEDERHIILAAGTHSGVQGYGDPRTNGWSQVGFTEHFYPGLFGEKTEIASHVEFIRRSIPWRAHSFKQMNAPFLVGEFQTVFNHLGGGALMRYYFDLYNQYGWAATMWSYKLLTRQGGLTENAWSIVSNRKPMPLVNITDSSKEEIEQLFQWFGQMEYCTNQSLVAAMQSVFPPPLKLPEILPMLTVAPLADPLPNGWTATQIGEGVPGGQRNDGPGAITVFGSGTDIWDVQDSLYYIARPAPNDFTISVTLNSLADTHQYAKAGIMLRTSDAPDAAHLLIASFPGGFTTIGWRAEPGKKMEQINLGPFHFPIQLTMTRRGSVVDVSCTSPNSHLAKKTISLSPLFSKNCRIGLAVCSRDAHYLTKAAFSNIQIQSGRP